MSQPQAATAISLPLHDLQPEPSDMLGEVLSGMSDAFKTLPCKYFYDRRGSKLFDRICELDEYYQTRTEVGILADSAAEIAERLGPSRWVVELGSGSSTKIRILLEALASPAGYVPIDISRDHLVEAAKRTAARFPQIRVHPVCADFNAALSLPRGVAAQSAGQRVLFFPGSTIGNFGPETRLELLEGMRSFCQPAGGQLLIGIDLVKDAKRLEAAYNDAAGVTAEFNLNLLRHINRVLDANFELDLFEHRAFYHSKAERIEMHLVSTRDQQISVGGHSFQLQSGEAICTEHSYKFTIDGFSQLASRAGWQLQDFWTDEEELFATLLLRSGPSEKGLA